MAFENSPLVNWSAFGDARSMLGADFVRILGYFREDGEKSVLAIEDAQRHGKSAQLVIPAHTLKGESYQFGAERLAAVAEHIEMTARRCVEQHQSPEELLEHVVGLRELFLESIKLLEKEANPLVERRGGFGRKPVGHAMTSFGRA
ncbi:MAG: Hpt domain-containing protein [Blastomonas sp.]